MHQFMRCAVATVMLAVVAACGGRELAKPVVVPEAEPYRLDSGDQLQITVFDQDALSGEYLVDGAGFISMPLIALAEARDRTARELEEGISEQLRSQGLVVDPSVNVQIVRYRPFFILGEVVIPGQFDYMANMSVLTAVAMAGGFTHRANTDGFTITRKVGNRVTEEPAQRNTLVRPGDVIFVRERIF